MRQPHPTITILESIRERSRALLVRRPRRSAVTGTALVLAIGILTACGTVSEAPITPPGEEPQEVVAEFAPAELKGRDIGGVKKPGYMQQDGMGESTNMQIGGSGEDIWGEADSFYFAHWNLTGDFEFTARVKSIDGTDPWAKAGLMVRPTLAPDARNATIAATQAGRVTFQRRETDASETVSTRVDDVGTPVWLRLVRQGGAVTGSYSSNGKAWTTLDTTHIDLPAEVYVGLAVTSHEGENLAEAQFDKITAVGHVAPDPGTTDGDVEEPEGDGTEADPEGDGNVAEPEGDGSEVDPEGDGDGDVVEPEGDGDETSEGGTDSGNDSAEPATGSEDSGLLYSAGEVSIWRNRALHGPYRTDGDVSTNSPGDWTRIVRKADQLLADPSLSHWNGNTGTTCYAWGDPAPPYGSANYMRDAAFTYLVTQDTRYRATVHDRLLYLAAQPGLDFTDTTRWCTGSLRDGNPAIEIANWLSQMLIAYDFLGEDSFTAEERATLDAWFYAAADYFRNEVHYDLKKNFVDRLNDDYRLTSYAQSMNASSSKTSHFGGWSIYSLQCFYNNRRALQARFFGLVGIKLDDSSLQDDAKRFVKEFITYSMFEDGILGDYERWLDRLPDLGWNYGASALSSIITLADAFARDGDTELYDYSTTDGAYGTQSSSGTRKSILLAIRTHQSYLLPHTERYATNDPATVGDTRARIDGTHEDANWYSAADVALIPANTYYQDPTIQSIYLRRHPGTDPYPSQPASLGHAPPWNGDWGLYPGVLFMYGQLEGVAEPYGTRYLAATH